MQWFEIIGDSLSADILYCSWNVGRLCFFFKKQTIEAIYPLTSWRLFLGYTDYTKTILKLKFAWIYCFLHPFSKNFIVFFSEPIGSLVWNWIQTCILNINYDYEKLKSTHKFREVCFGLYISFVTFHFKYALLPV